MNNPTTMWEVEKQYLRLVKQNKHAEAHQLITKNVDVFDQHAQKIVFYWRFWTAAMQNKVKLTLELLAEAIDDGHWYSGLVEDEDFECVHQEPKFVELVQVCKERREVAKETAVRTHKALQPQNGIPCKFEVYPDLGHSFPPTFAQQLPRFLDFVME